MSKPTQIEEALEWAQTTEKLELSPEELEKMRQLIENPPAPSDWLRAAAARYRERQCRK